MRVERYIYYYPKSKIKSAYYYVKFTWAKKRYSKIITVSKYKNKKEALLVAKNWLNFTLDTIGKPYGYQGRGSGYGVYLVDYISTKTAPSGKTRSWRVYGWVAHAGYHPTTGKMLNKRFSITKHGYDNAYKMACEWLEEKIKMRVDLAKVNQIPKKPFGIKK